MTNTSSCLPHNALEATLVPLDCLAFSDLVAVADLALRAAALGDALTRSCHAAVEIHAVNANGRVVLDAKIDVFADAKAEVASLREVAGAQFVFLDFEASLENFFSLGSTHRDVHCDLLVTADTECSNGVAGFGVDGRLAAELLKHFGCAGQSIAGFANRDVQNQFLKAQLVTVKKTPKGESRTWIFNSLIGFCDLSDFSACIIVRVPLPELLLDVL